jgi:anti-anti-sigma regulatory factor
MKPHRAPKSGRLACGGPSPAGAPERAGDPGGLPAMGATMDSSGELAVRIEADGNRRILFVEGRLDLPNAGVLRQALLDGLEGDSAGNSCTAIDLHGAETVDLCGLQLLCSAHRTYVQGGGTLTLQGMPERFHETATHAGFVMNTLRCRHRRGIDCIWRD